MLLIPLEVVPILLERDIDGDAGSTPGSAGSADDELYQRFLEHVEDSRSERRTLTALDGLRRVGDARELEALFREYPELSTNAAAERLAEWHASAASDEERRVAVGQMELRHLASLGSYAEAWSGYESHLRGLFSAFLAPRIEKLLVELEDAEEKHDWSGLIAIGDALRVEAMRAGDQELAMFASMRLANGLFESQTGDRAENLERAIALLEQVNAFAADTGMSDHDRAGALTNLAAALAARVRGDPVVNQERAIDFNSQALALLTPDLDANGWAMTHTNLGLSLLELVNLRATHEPLDETDSADQAERNQLIGLAIDHFRAALRVRTREKDPLGWAFTEINLGVAYSRRRGRLRGLWLLRALRHYRRSAAGFLDARAVVQRALALQDCAAVQFDLATLLGAETRRGRRMLRDARETAETALSERSIEDSPIDAGRNWKLLGDILSALGDRKQARDAYLEALEGLAPLAAPRDSRATAQALAFLASADGDWPVAASAWETAALAAVAAWNERATHEGRLDELRENLNIFRFAAYALARAGRAERAAEILEMGRGRELAVWLHDDLTDIETLRHLEPGIAARYDDLRQQLAKLGPRQDVDAEADRVTAGQLLDELHRVIEAIRLLPGHASFLGGPTIAELREGVPPGHAVVYLITAPSGALALALSPAGVLISEARGVGSAELLRPLLEIDVKEERVGGYLAAHELADDDAVDTALDDFSNLLGGTLLRPLTSELQAAGVESVTLVPVSLMAVLPIHALTWREGGREACLLDFFDIAYAPSARVAEVCRRRAAERGGKFGRLLVVGNPLPHPQPLEYAERESELVADIASADSTTRLIGVEATKAALLREVPGTSHIHLACHGQASIMDITLTASLSLANGEPLRADELLGIQDLSPRLIVMSACESGVIQGYETADESLALSTVFLAAGAAGVVASLWAVDDYATALLMSRFYEALSDTAGNNPARALRLAQLWLRDLSAADERNYVAARPKLRAFRDARLRRRHLRATGPAENRPFGRRTLWAPFVLAGA
jgi:CHAT domain-containing protein/tetratricopeptide (TPR) repeat protein